MDHPSKKDPKIKISLMKSTVGRHLFIFEMKYFVKLEVAGFTLMERVTKGKLSGIKEPWLSIFIYLYFIRMSFFGKVVFSTTKSGQIAI